jgi:soluble lytic murein transglycosylase
MAPATFQAGISGNRLDQITMQAESGGRRFSSNGRLLRGPMTSYGERAMGEMQVMPATARDPGFGVKPWDGRSPDDLARVGRDYRRAMQREFNGDPAAMWSAYNYGPGATKALIKRHGSRWLDHAPAETRNYVARNLRAMRGS